MQNLTKDIEVKTAQLSRKLLQQKGARDQLVKNIKQESEAIEALVVEQQNFKQAHIFMMAELTELRAEALKNFEELVSTGLSFTYGPDYGLKFDTFDEKRAEDGSASYKMEMRVVSNLDGKPASFILQGGKGGGVHERIAAIARDAMLSFVRYDGVMMYDEAFNFVSRDDKLGSVAEMMRHMADMTGRQYLFVTHLVDEFAPVADQILRLYNEDGIVRSEQVRPEDIVDIEEQYGTEEED